MKVTKSYIEVLQMSMRVYNDRNRKVHEDARRFSVQECIPVLLRVILCSWWFIPSRTYVILLTWLGEDP